MGSEMDTFAARLASFDVVLKLEKRRSSTTKGSNVISWPHTSPSPAELAHAGFYYKPYETNPDNTTCFHCNRALDGWEEDDNPITEHLKHSPDCAWAIMMDIQQSSSNPATIEDPNSERITLARMETFGNIWPHDGKRGWLCQSEKMVKAGWYFCPNEESDDLASCAYCKLSLDGWEPKDDPFDEHYRRSPDCSFFVFAQLAGKKGKSSRSKKTRSSKASSRLSTQSVATVSSEAPEQSEMDLDDSMDDSVVSQIAIKPKATKKASKGKGKKSKKEEAESQVQMEVDTNDSMQPDPPKPRRGRPKKRVSEEISKDDIDVAQIPAETSEEPPSKRRATRTRSSSISQTYKYDLPDQSMPDAVSADEGQNDEPKKTLKGSKKKASKSRKASDASVTSKSTSKARMPRDSELEAEIEAGLEADDPEAVDHDMESAAEPHTNIQQEPEAEPEKPRTSKKTKSGKKSKAAGKSSHPPQEDIVDDTVPEEQPESAAIVALSDDEEAPIRKTKSTKGSKKKGSKKTKKNEAMQEDQPEIEDKLGELEGEEPERHDSFVSVEIMNQDDEAQPDPMNELPMDKPAKKQSSRKEDKNKKTKKTKKMEASPSPPAPRPIEDELGFESSPRVEEEDGTADDLPEQIQVVPSPRAPSPELHHSHQKTPVPPKTTKRFSDIPQEEHFAQSLAESHRSRRSSRKSSQKSPQAISPLPAPQQSTPSLSPQSSDAENRPPSSLPSAKRPVVVASPPKEKTARTPPPASTPSPTKRNSDAGFPVSGHPWTPVDIEEVLFGQGSDTENADLAGVLNGAKGGLTSPEKRMTVEEWIMWNARNGEERLKRECERLVSRFEQEGGRAMRRLEAIECID